MFRLIEPSSDQIKNIVLVNFNVSPRIFFISLNDKYQHNALRTQK